MPQFLKRLLGVAAVNIILLLSMPLAVHAAAAFTSFHMDRTTVEPGQSITITMDTTSETNFVFAEMGGVRTQATQVNPTATGRRWTITLTPSENITRIDLFANTSNSTFGGAASISIPIIVANPTVIVPPGGQQPHGGLDIISITEIQAQMANQVRLEIVTGPEAAEVWVTHGNNTRWARAERVSTGHHTQTWQVGFIPSPANQTVQVSANLTYVVAGANTQNYTIRHSAPYVPPANPVIWSATANPTQIALGQSSTISIQTNGDVNFVWIMVDGVRVNASLVNTSTNVLATAFRNWTATVSPNTSGNVVVYANATDTAVGAATRSVFIESSLSRVVISLAMASWHPNSSASNRGVRIVVHTNLEATHLTVVSGSRNIPFDHTDTVNNSRIRAGNIWIWEMNINPPNGFADNIPIHITASDIGNIFFGSGQSASVTISGVGGTVSNIGQGQTTSNLAWDINFDPPLISANYFWELSAEFVTANDVTEVRVRDTNYNFVTPITNHFTPGANNTRIWRIPSFRPTIPANATRETFTSMSLIVEVRRGTGSWTAVPAVTLPVRWDI